MSNYAASPRSTLIVGMTGSGKTTFALKYLQRSPVACRFIFDDQAQASNRLKIPLASTPEEMDRALATRWVCYNPHVMFKGEQNKAFAWFCEWAFEAAKRGPGWKQIMVDEIWRFQDRDKIPQPLAVVSQMGRVEELELVSLTQHPHLVNSSITGSSTEMICFRLDESIELLKIKKLGAPAEEVQKLPLGSYIALNRLTRELTRGKMF
jgi:hypothetical protein